MSARVVASLRRDGPALTSLLGGKTARHCDIFRRIPFVGAATIIRNCHNYPWRYAPPPPPPQFQRCWHSSTSKEGKIPFLLADIGEGIKEVEVMEWHVAPGDRVQQFDPICTVQSDKATVEITSRYDGVIASLSPGSMLQVGQPLLYLESTVSEPEVTPDAPISIVADQAVVEDPSTSSRETTVPDAAISPPVESASSRSESARSIIPASPAVRRLCREHGIALEAIYPGSGPQQRVLKSDVLAHLSSAAAASIPSSSSSSVVESTKDRVTMPFPSPTEEKEKRDEEGKDIVIPIRGIRRHMVQSMTAALQVPHMCFGEEVCLNELLALREQWKAHRRNDENLDAPSLLAWMIKALSAALRDCPQLNAIHTVSPDDDGSYAILQRHDQNIGIAMDTPHGLMVPVIRSCQTLSLVEIEAQLRLLKQLAHANQLTPRQIQDRTFTLSNIGSMGSGAYMQPVLVPPVLAMGTLGRLRIRPRYRPGSEETQLYPASILPVTWAGDHRFVDGASLGRFHNRFAQYVEEPWSMISQWK
jgi:2-oxoisovalerate dehydrogenase E2 component (dihydrolipoyl transacylase)